MVEIELLHQVGKKLGRGLGFREKCLNPTVAGQFSKEVGAVRGKMAFFIGQDFVGPLAFRTLRGVWDVGQEQQFLPNSHGKAGETQVCLS